MSPFFTSAPSPVETSFTTMSSAALAPFGTSILGSDPNFPDTFPTAPDFGASSSLESDPQAAVNRRAGTTSAAAAYRAVFVGFISPTRE